MTYFPKTFTTLVDIAGGSQTDPFHRLKVGLPFSIFDSKQIVPTSVENVNWVTSSVNGASSSYSQNRASTTLFCAALSGSRFIRQTRRRMNYQSGKGITVSNTFTLGTGSAGIVKRVGYFDDNNGVFLEQSGTNINIVLRSSKTGTPVETRVSQSNWSNNKFDGTDVYDDGADDHIDALQVTSSQIFFLDFQWLGVGKVRTGFFQGNDLFFAHQFEHANIDNGVYMSSPNQPVRYEIENYTGTSSGSLETICTSVMAEGNYNNIGFTRSASRANVTKSVTAAAGIIKPLITIKLASGSYGATVIPVAFEVLATSNCNFRWMVYLNPTYTGADGPVWYIPSGSNTSVLYDITRNGTINGGMLLDSGYGTATTQAKQTITADFQASFNLGWTLDGVSDEIVLAVEPDATATFLAKIKWEEF